MNAKILSEIIIKIKSDPDHYNERRVFHENYEWLEYFWRDEYKNGDNSINNFIADKAEYFWTKPDVKDFAKEIAQIECIGSNKSNDYIQSQETAGATMYLRSHCNLFTGTIPDCNSIQCRDHKQNIGLCNALIGRHWKKIDNDNHAAFRALIYIIRQARQNLFHGHKMSLEQHQFDRDKEIVSISARTTSYLLNNLVATGN